jgi:cytochrome c oxidase subunit 3
LILSSVTAAWAVRCAQLNQQRGLVINIVVTMACALTFMCVKYFEYSHKVHDGLLWGRNFNPAHEVWELDAFKSKHPEAAKLAEEIVASAKRGKSPATAGVPAAAGAAATLPAGATAAPPPAAAQPTAAAAGAAAPPATAAPAPAADAPAAAAGTARPTTTAEAQGEGTAPGTESAPQERAAAQLKRSAKAGPGAAAEAARAGSVGDVAEGTDPSYAARQAQPAAAEPAAVAEQAQAAPAPAAPAINGVSLVGRDPKREIEPLVEAGLIGENSKVVASISHPKKAHIFFGIYFFMTGLHGLHVLAGIAVWAWLLVRALKGQFGRDYFGPIDYAALYWHLVDLIWIYLFPLLYLID